MNHRETAESILSRFDLHLKYNAIFFYAGHKRGHHVKFLQHCHGGLQHFLHPENSENFGRCMSINLLSHVEKPVCCHEKLQMFIKVSLNVSI